MSERWWPWIRQHVPWLALFVIAVPMLVISGITGDHDLVFPEGAALAFGVLSLRLPAWSMSPALLASVPATCAAVGVALTYVPAARWVGEIAALSIALVLLQTVRSRLIPSISAAMFPLVFNVHSWQYPLMVLLIGVTLGVSLKLRNRHARAPRRRHREVMEPWTAFTGWAMVATWILIAGPGLHLPAAALAPPLFVAAFEWLTNTDQRITTGLRQWAIIAAAAAAGSILARTLNPYWLGGLLALAATLILFAVILRSFGITPHRYPPALAICLIPQVARTTSSVTFVAAIATGAGFLALAANGLHRITASRGAT